MWNTWRTVTAAADAYLDTLTPELLLTHFEREGKPVAESVGTMLLRNLYHYWFHNGEAYAIRQMLGHIGLPDFVGDMSAAAAMQAIDTGGGKEKEFKQLEIKVSVLSQLERVQKFDEIMA